MYRKFVKRVIDFTLSLVAIIILIPAYIIIAVIVRIKMGSPVLFSQERIGKNEKPFKLYKFRSMTDERDADGSLLDETLRLTKIGTFIRSSSLDELPELFLILTGKMSIIGPRPLPTYYGPFFHEDERVRHIVRGGLLPPDSLSGRPLTIWEEQFEYETYYAKNVSFLLDVKVLFTTLKILIRRFTTNYGSDFRPHLNVYRTNEMVKQEISID
ncbi:MAG: sugar transferase [bacterium]|jgi:undecaprenyl phosphate N,N'-diacetylbacillosamine 1-phosphate transferase